jgi:hypothetical protein
MKNKNNKNTAHYFVPGTYVYLDGGSEPFLIVSNNPPGQVQGVVINYRNQANIAIRSERLKPVQA